MKPVIQEEKTGCAIASAAAIAGLSYEEAKKAANALGINAEDESLWSDTGHIRRLLDQLGFKTGLASLFPYGDKIITIAVFLFAISTAISWSYYGDRGIQYLNGNKSILPYKWIFVFFHFVGSLVSLEIVWGFGDIALGLMAFPNLIALILLSPKILEMTRDYFSRHNT